MIDSRLNDILEDEYRDRYRRTQEAMSRDGIDQCPGYALDTAAKTRPESWLVDGASPAS